MGRIEHIIKVNNCEILTYEMFENKAKSYYSFDERTYLMLRFLEKHIEPIDNDVIRAVMEYYNKYL